jgi:DNA modification methylase
MKPYYETELGKLYHGDCLEIMPELEPVDLVLTDPPYGVGKAEWDSSFPTKSIWSIIYNKLKVGGNFLLIPGEKFLPQKINLISSVFDYQWVIPWYKPNAMQFGKTGYSKHSLVWWFSNGKPTNKPRRMIDVIVAPLGKKEDKDIGHPSPKPLSVIEQLLLGFNFEKDIVNDPFLGSGTTAVACERLNRRWIGIEIEEKYCEIAAKRIENERKQLKLWNT